MLRRREAILRIVQHSTVHSQDELQAALRRNGVSVTQPTLSRDLRDLGLAKTARGYVAPGVVDGHVSFAPPELHDERLNALFRDSVLSAEAALNLVVIRTPPAAAQPVAIAIDAADIDGILGTVGGDDTIFVAFRDAAKASAFSRRIHTAAGFPPARRRTR